MGIENCPFCGGTHIGQNECPFPLCPRCQKRAADRIFLGSTGEGHICGECWQQDRADTDNGELTNLTP